jgi:hypothetical protein
METPEELLTRRRAGLSLFADESKPVLREFATDLGALRPEDISLDPLRFSDLIDRWCSQQELSDDDAIWLTTRIAYFLGAVIIHRYRGTWDVCDHPGHGTYGRYVVSAQGKHFDVFDAAHSFVGSPPPRSLREAIASLRAAN